MINAVLVMVLAAMPVFVQFARAAEPEKCADARIEELSSKCQPGLEPGDPPDRSEALRALRPNEQSISPRAKKIPRRTGLSRMRAEVSATCSASTCKKLPVCRR